MCGIIGQANRSSAFEKAFSLLAHRGPDGDGVIDFGKVCFGHRRLAILDLSQRAAQPMLTTHGKLGIVFNGEIYNFLELKADLEKEGVNFLTTGDTEVVLKGYEKHGLDFFKRLRGMWAFAIYDGRADEQIILARDPFGIKPLYYSLHGKDNTLVFASEIKSVITSIPSVSPNHLGYEWFFTHGYFLSPHTPYQEIMKVEPGSIMVYEVDAKAIRSADKVSLGLSGQYGNLKEALIDSVKAHYVSDVPVGVLFSGGVDSSLLAALSKELGHRPTLFHVALPNSIDTKYAQKVATHLGLTMETLQLDQAISPERYQEIFASIDEPSGDPSLFASHILYSLVQGKSKVVLGGEGGDELFAGYYRHAQLLGRTTGEDRLGLLVAKICNVLPVAWMRKAVALLGRMRQTGLSFGYYANIRMHPYQNIPRAFAAISNYLKEKVVELPQFLWPDLLAYLRSGLLYKGDISSMRYSVEARTPLLDRKLFHFLSDNQSIYKQAPFVRKAALKKLLSEYLPEDLVLRPKAGFSPDLAALDLPWYRDDLASAVHYHKEKAKFLKLEERLISYLENAPLDELVAKYPRLAFALVTNWKIHKEIWPV